MVASGCAKKKEETANKTPPPQTAEKSENKRESDKSPPKPHPNSKGDSKLAVRLKKRGLKKGSAPGLIGQSPLRRLQLPLSRPSGFYSLPIEWLTDNKPNRNTLGATHEALLQALNSTGLTDGSTYHLDGGFAIATQLEQIDETGKPLAGKFRFDLNAKPRGKIWERLFLPKKGRWRMLLVIVSNVDLQTAGKTLTRDQAAALAKDGSKNGLPSLVARRSLTPQHECTAFVYEFEQKDDKQPATQIARSSISAETHLAALIAKLKADRPKR